MHSGKRSVAVQPSRDLLHDPRRCCRKNPMMSGKNTDGVVRHPTMLTGRPVQPEPRARLGSSAERCYVTCNRFESSQMTRARPVSSREKVRAHRERLRNEGLRPIQVWVPDVRSPAFAAEAHRQSLAAAMSPHADEDQAFIDAVSIRGDE
jgi:hypothetical protein